MIVRAAPDAVVIGICTYQRPSVADTLASLARLALPTNPLSILVADNDVTPSAQQLVARIAATHPLPLHYLHAPARNISVARNAILQASRQADAHYLAFLDDDELAHPGWLNALLKRQAATAAEGVVGPVRARYCPEAPRWMQAAAVHDMRLDPGKDGFLGQGHTANVLLDLTAPALLGLCFDPDRGRTGGEDTAFFHKLLLAGGRVAWAPDAVVEETVPRERASLGWLLRRRYRMGQTHGSLIGDGKKPHSRLIAMALAGAKVVACLGMAGLRFLNTEGRNRALMRGALHTGVVAELVGLDRIEPYGDGTSMRKTQAPEGQVR